MAWGKETEMAWTTTELASAVNANRADRTQAQQEVVDIAARMFLEFLNAQTRAARLSVLSGKSRHLLSTLLPTRPCGLSGYACIPMSSCPVAL